MDKIIGVGKLGCAIAEQLTEHPEYRIYQFDTDLDERGSFSLDPCNDMKEYEESIDQKEVEVYLKGIKKKDTVLLIAEGGDPTTGVILKILETVRSSTLNVLYICPDRTMSSETRKRDDKVAFNILQEYARSAVFSGIYLVSKSTVEALVGDVSIEKYEESIAHFVSYVVAMVNYFNHTEPILASKIEPRNISKIISFGISSLDEDQQDIRMLFPLEESRDIHFFYGIPEEALANDASLMKKIKKHVKDHREPGISTSFSVYSTKHEAIMVLCLAYSSKIQPLLES